MYYVPANVMRGITCSDSQQKQKSVNVLWNKNNLSILSRDVNFLILRVIMSL